jgi:hypothetical protein
MAVTNLNELYGATLNSALFEWYVPNSGSMSAGADVALWRYQKMPVAGAIPTTAAVCNASTPGALPLIPRSGSQDRILTVFAAQTSADAGTYFELQDRLIHMGNLSTSSTSPQSVDLDLHANLANSNLAQRIGPADYSEVQWYLEAYASLGGVTSAYTINVTLDDGNPGTAVLDSTIAGTLLGGGQPGTRYRLRPPPGRHIRAIVDFQMATSKGGSNNCGFTAVRRLAQQNISRVASMEESRWFQNGAPVIADNACLTLQRTVIGTNLGNLNGYIVQGVQ